MIIFRYLTKEILATLLAATLLLLVIFVTNQSLQFLQRAALGQIPATQILHVILLQIPLLLPYVLPLGLYLGVLLTLSRMHLDSEMTVLSACGVSRAKITRMVLAIALFVALIVAWLMASIVPKAQGQINAMLNKAAVTASVQQVIPGRFMVFGRANQNPIVFYAAKVHEHTALQGVFLAQRAKDGAGIVNKWSVIVSKSAVEKKFPNHQGHYVIFSDGYRYSGVPGEKNYRILRFKTYGARLTVADIPTPNAVQYYSFMKLWSISPKDKSAAAELQWRLAMPISVLVFALLAVPLSEVRPRYGKFTQLFPAILIYIAYADLIFLSRSWISAGKLSATWGMWWVHGSALLLAALLMLYRVGWRRIQKLFSGNKK
ncbi:MAG: LPS export ABC transporter permease LptF [Gammaproteobacteria bacterium]|nr:LPS export ABC transporter permease LptF [Gammaproteobacteria bacterium]